MFHLSVLLLRRNNGTEGLRFTTVCHKSFNLIYGRLKPVRVTEGLTGSNRMHLLNITNTRLSVLHTYGTGVAIYKAAPRGCTSKEFIFERKHETMKGKYGLDFASEVRELKIARYYLVVTSLAVVLQMVSWILGK